MDSFLSFLKWKWPKKGPKMPYFMLFWPILGLYEPLKSLLHYQRSTLNGSYSPKILHKIVLTENGFIYLFWSENGRKVPKMSYFMLFWPILGQYHPLKSSLHYQRSTWKGSYSLEILHKILLPENVFISIFSEVKMTKNCQNVIFHAILTNFGTIWPTQKPLTLPKKYFKGLTFSQNTP